MLALVGCYDPHAATGIPCTEEGACPRKQECVANVCVAIGTAVVDAEDLDAPLPDAPAIDAAPDAPPDMPVPAAPSFINRLSRIESSTSSTIGTPIGAQVGDLIVTFVSHDNASLVFTAPSGWTKVTDIANATNGIAAAVFVYALVDPAASYVWGFPGTTRHSIDSLVYRGVALATPVDDAQRVSRIDPIAPSVTSSGPNRMLVVLFAVDNAAGPLADIPGMTERLDVAAGGYLVGASDEPRVAGPTGTRATMPADPGNALAFALLLNPD